jgi:hypothetical protein
VATNLAFGRQLAGAGGCTNSANGACLFGDQVNDTATMNLTSPDTSAHTWLFTFTYLVL